MSNHFHVVLRPNLQKNSELSDRQVAQSWASASVRMDKDGTYTAPSEKRLAEILAIPGQVATYRKRMGKVSWFMKALKEPLSRMSNAEDDCSGAFWEGRYASIPLLDRAALIGCMAYVDLNPLRARMTQRIEDSEHTSIRIRAAAYAAEHALTAIDSSEKKAMNTAAKTSTVTPSLPTKHTAQHIRKKLQGNIDAEKWLSSISSATSGAGGLIPGITRKRYIELVEITACIIRGNKHTLDASARDTLQRLELNADTWLSAMSTPQTFIGRVIGNTTSLLNEATRSGVKWVQQKCRLFHAAQTE